MSDKVTRRGAIRALATGAALAAGGTAAAKALESTGSSPSESIDLGQSQSIAHSTGRPIQRRESSGTRQGQVFHCRSWDSSIYLWISDDIKGFVQVNAQAFAIAAACQAAGRKVFVQYWGHEPRWADGTGRFDGVLLAMDRGDLPG